MTNKISCLILFEEDFAQNAYVEKYITVIFSYVFMVAWKAFMIHGYVLYK